MCLSTVLLAELHHIGAKSVNVVDVCILTDAGVRKGIRIGCRFNLWICG